MIINLRNMAPDKFVQLLHDSRDNFARLLLEEYDAKEIDPDELAWRRFKFKDHDKYLLFLFRYG